MRRQSGYQLLECEGWKEQLRELEKGRGIPEAAEELSQSFGLMKSTVCEIRKAAGEGPRVREFVISDGSVDRDFDRIKVTGWDLKAYRKNPVVLFAHDSRSLPIAKSLRVSRDGDDLVAVAEFTPFDLNPLGDAVFQMLDQGFLRTASVGFRPLKAAPAEEEERRERFGLDFEKQELLEWSVVPVPANANAIARAHDAGINTRPIKSWAEMVLDLREPLPGLGLNDIEAAWKAARGPERLVIWVESEEKSEQAEEPETPEVVTEPEETSDPETEEEPEELPQAASGQITFQRRADGAYTVLRDGAAVMVVEQPDDVEWDEDGVLRRASGLDSSWLSALDLKSDEPEEDADLIEISGDPDPKSADPEFDLDVVAEAVKRLIEDQVSQAVNAR